MNPIVPIIKTSTLVLEKNMPKILTGVAACTSIAACVSTGVATWDSKDIVNEYNEQAEIYKKLIENEPNELKAAEYEAQFKKLRYLTAAELACEYAVPTILLGGSIASCIGSEQIFSKRIGALAASYAILSSSYSRYRKRVADTVGTEKEDELYKGIVEKEIEYTDEKGKVHKKKVKSYDDIPANGEFCVFWICGNNPYSFDDPDLDINFLEGLEDEITRIINTNGYIFADDTYKTVAITPPTVPLGGKAADYVGKLWHNFGKIKSQERINSTVEWLDNAYSSGEWINILNNEGISADQGAWDRYCEERIYNANRFSWGISDEQKRAFRNGDTDGMLLLCPNFDGDIFTNGAFMTLHDEDVYLEEKYWGMRPYE